MFRDDTKEKTVRSSNNVRKYPTDYIAPHQKDSNLQNGNNK
jgi:hypothetical protein